MSSVATKQLKIEGMHCSSCAMNIDFDLEDLEGVVYSKTSYSKQEAQVQYDEEKTSLEKIIEQVEKTGYKVNLDKN